MPSSTATARRLKVLKGLDFVDADNVVIFGHSMGGVMGPLLAAETPVKGIAAYGTAASHGMNTSSRTPGWQMALAGASASEIDEALRKDSAINFEVFVEGKSPGDVARRHPDLGGRIGELIAGGRYYAGRHFIFFKQLAGKNMAAAWERFGGHAAGALGQGRLRLLRGRPRPHRLDRQQVSSRARHLPGDGRDRSRVQPGRLPGGELQELGQAGRVQPDDRGHPARLGLEGHRRGRELPVTQHLIIAASLEHGTVMRVRYGQVRGLVTVCAALAAAGVTVHDVRDRRRSPASRNPGLPSSSWTWPGARLVIIDPATRKVRSSVETGPGPHEVAASADGHLAFVANYGTQAVAGQTLSVIDMASGKELRRADLGAFRRPHGLAVVGGKVYFTAEANRAVGRYDPEADKVDRVIGLGQDSGHT